MSMNECKHETILEVRVYEEVKVLDVVGPGNIKLDPPHPVPAFLPHILFEKVLVPVERLVAGFTLYARPPTVVENINHNQHTIFSVCF